MCCADLLYSLISLGVGCFLSFVYFLHRQLCHLQRKRFIFYFPIYITFIYFFSYCTSQDFKYIIVSIIGKYCFVIWHWWILGDSHASLILFVGYFLFNSSLNKTSWYSVFYFTFNLNTVLFWFTDIVFFSFYVSFSSIFECISHRIWWVFYFRHTYFP